MNHTSTAPATHSTAIPEEVLTDLFDRLDQTVWPTRAGGTSTPGFDVDRLRPLVERWRTGFDWRAIENTLDQMGQVVTTSEDGRRLHAFHVKGSGGPPVLLIHGWPDSPLRFVEVIPRLTDAGHTVVVPSIPGVGFSEEPECAISRELVAEDFHALMLELGYPRYAVHGGDWGAAIATTLASSHPETVIALHLTDVPFDLTFTIDPSTASEAEVAYLRSIEHASSEQIYQVGNILQPDLVALALANSPVALLGWLAHLYDQWRDDEIAIDHILANASLLWLTGTIRSSMRLYSEPAGDWDESSWDADSMLSAMDSDNGQWGESGGTNGAGDDSWVPGRVEVPTAFAMFPKDLSLAPRELAEKHFAVERFTIMPRGGHIAALEQPELLVQDILDFFRGRS